MNINVRADSVEIEGYVNAVERNSKTLWSRAGQFIERICKGAFNKALKRNDDVHILLNHDWNRDLGSTKKGNLELQEDSIGLKARATITDKDVVEKAKHGDLVGWSFGFTDRSVDNNVENGIPTRLVRDLNLYEVSLLDRTKEPAYDGTLVYTREDTQENHLIGEEFIDEVNVRIIEEKQDEVREQEQVQEQDANIEQNASNEKQDADVHNEDVPKQQEIVDKNKQIDYSQAQAIIDEMKKF